MGISIRLANMSDADLDGICAVQNAVTPDEPTDPEDLRWSAGRYPGGAYILAETPGGRAVATAKVGRIYVYPPEYDAYWADVAVLPDARRRGIGTALLVACSEVARGATWPTGRCGR
jgi:GNAT superfamily N-acetyltransferase